MSGDRRAGPFRPSMPLVRDLREVVVRRAILVVFGVGFLWGLAGTLGRLLGAR